MLPVVGFCSQALNASFTTYPANVRHVRIIWQVIKSFLACLAAFIVWYQKPKDLFRSVEHRADQIGEPVYCGVLKVVQEALVEKGPGISCAMVFLFHCHVLWPL